jgi:hypothetical protein
VTGGGEVGSASSSAGGVERGEASDNVVGASGVGNYFDGGIAGHDKRERSKSLSSLKSLRSSPLFCRFLVLLAVGGRSSVEEGSGGVADGELRNSELLCMLYCNVEHCS